MDDFEDTLDDETSAHLLLLGDTKTGKSDYVANAILAGFHCIYVDSDNGGPTLSRLLPKGSEARKRLIYIRTKSPYTILKNFTETGIFRWNRTADKEFLGATGHDPEDKVIEVRPGRIPSGFLVVFDGWTGIANDVMRIAARGQSISITDIAKSKASVKRNIYQEAGIRLNASLDILQKVKFFLIVQGHGQFYERKEKPPGVNDATEDEMIIKETILIPFSCSQPHGYGMGKYFNEIAWTRVDPKSGNRVLDFDVKADRTGGGSVTGFGDPREEYSFSNLFCKEPIQYSEDDIALFFKQYAVKDYSPPQAAGKPVVSPAAPTGNLPPAGSPTTGTPSAPKSAASSLLLKKK